MKPLCYTVLLCLLFLAGAPAFAQNKTPVSGTQDSKAPLEITADGTLEWLRNDKQLIARTNALATQGDSSVAGQTLTADYREGAEGKGMEIWKVTAETGVILTSKTNKAYGEKAVYNLDDGLATLTGGDLKMLSPDQTVTARERFEYHVEQGLFSAIGQAKVVRPKPEGGQDTLSADKISAVFEKNAVGQQALKTLEAFDHVVITTPTETITGTYGLYKASTNTAEIKGGVEIVRGPNTLKGDRAEVDMNTNTSKIFGGDSAKTRVHGVFYPNSRKTP